MLRHAQLLVFPPFASTKVQPGGCQRLYKISSCPLKFLDSFILRTFSAEEDSPLNLQHLWLIESTATPTLGQVFGGSAISSCTFRRTQPETFLSKNILRLVPHDVLSLLSPVRLWVHRPRRRNRSLREARHIVLHHPTPDPTPRRIQVSGSQLTRPDEVRFPALSSLYLLFLSNRHRRRSRVLQVTTLLVHSRFNILLMSWNSRLCIPPLSEDD